jgi:nitroreductase
LTVSDRNAPADHPLHDLIASRWSPRALEPRGCPAGTLRSILEAARWSASCFNDQPWFFLVARREDEAEFARMLDCVVEGNRGWAANGGALLMSVARTTFGHNGKPNRHAIHDLGLATAQLTLEALAHDVFVHQMGGILPDAVREIYGVPEDHEVVAGIVLGYRGDTAGLPEALAEREGAPRERKPQSAFVFEGSWGRGAGF